MTRDEWVVLPGGERLHRESVWLYYEKPTALGWTFVEIAHGGIARTLDFNIPLAEFEALLFAPATPAPDGTYRDAAVRYAEAWMDDTVSEEAAIIARDRFARLYRERHGG